MTATQNLGLWRGVALVAVLFVASYQTRAEAVDVTVVEETATRVVLRYDFAAPTMDAVEIDGQKHAVVTLAGEGLIKDVGVPELPRVGRSIIIPSEGTPTIRVLSESYTELTDVVVAPSKGYIKRSVDPATVPYSFGTVYQDDALYPANVAGVRTPYILRNYRGVTIDVFPVQHNPVQQTLRVYRSVVVEVVTKGVGGVNVMSAAQTPRADGHTFDTIYRHHFVNRPPSLVNYPAIDEEGDMLIICHDAWLPNVQPLVAHKNSRGIATTAVGVSTIPGGNTASAIQAYIQNVYDTSNLAFILLVGDATHVKPALDGSSAADPIYAKLAGADDYPDAIVGRFSAQTAADVDTQVERAIDYETEPAPLQDWFWQAAGIGSDEGPGDDGEYDYEHLNNIRTELLGYDYTLVHQLYETTGVTSAQVAAAINTGVGLVNYTGHGSASSWSSSGFSNSNVNALLNTGKLPIVFSVACNNGEFNNYTSCFAETWLRATYNGAPAGAAGFYGSSISCYWYPPMEAQDEFNHLLTTETYVTFGALCFAGSCSMMDAYPPGNPQGAGVDLYNTWILFGDPSLALRSNCLSAGTIELDRGLFGCEDTATITVRDCDLNVDPGVADTVLVTIASDSEPAGESVLLTETDVASGQFSGSIALSATDNSGVLQVGVNDTITATYIDADDGADGYDVVLTADAAVDCTPPVIGNVQTTYVDPRAATITFDANEPVSPTVYYGTSCGDLTESVTRTTLSMSPEVELTGLDDATTYYYMVVASDEAGNTSSDDNGGACYSFTTPEVPDYFTEQFTTSSPFDLAYKQLTFRPEGNTYIPCTEDIAALPNDPASGTTLTIAEDGEAAIAPSQNVAIYGVPYGTLYVNANGFVTFGESDWDYTESYTDHFSAPRVAALFDDLSPPNGGRISWEELSDRVVITWEDLPEYQAIGANTFQIEIFFDGMIKISYTDVSATDGLAGISAGTGLDPYFLASDLSGYASCGAHAPFAQGDTINTDVDTPVVITLVAFDDGLPDPPAAVVYVVKTLPSLGTLREVGGDPIAAVPHTLPAGVDEVEYTPPTGYVGSEMFTFAADDGGTPPAGGMSNTAIIAIEIGGPRPVVSYPLDSDPGWPRAGEWAFGVPAGLGGEAHGNPDPAAGVTGEHVFGVNLEGDYATSASGPHYVTLGPVDLTGFDQVSLRFHRWLNCDMQNYAFAMVEVSTDGVAWDLLWENESGSMSDSAWIPMVLPTPQADEASTVWFRWGYRISSYAWAYSGWNIDDIEVWGRPLLSAPVCPGDANCDGYITYRDIDYFVAGMNGDEAAWKAMFADPNNPGCSYQNLDCNGDTFMNFHDIDPFVGLMNTSCPQ